MVTKLPAIHAKPAVKRYAPTDRDVNTFQEAAQLELQRNQYRPGNGAQFRGIVNNIFFPCAIG